MPQPRESGAARKGKKTAAGIDSHVLEVPPLLADQREYISTIVAWERTSRNQGAIIRGRVRRVGKTDRS